MVLMSLVVATTNTGFFFSESHVRKVASTRDAVPESPELPPFMPPVLFSISSLLCYGPAASAEPPALSSRHRPYHLLDGCTWYRQVAARFGLAEPYSFRMVVEPSPVLGAWLLIAR